LGKEFHEQRDFSEHTAQVIDEEVARILHAAAERARSLLDQHRAELDKVSQALEEREVLDEHELEALIGPSANRRHEGNGHAEPSVAPGQPISAD
jgi:cell division protease FtsH